MFIKPVNDFPREKQDEAQLEYLSLADSHSFPTHWFPPPLAGGRLYLLSHQFWIKVKVALIYDPLEKLQAFPMLSHSSDSNVPRPSWPPVNLNTN